MPRFLDLAVLRILFSSPKSIRRVISGKARQKTKVITRLYFPKPCKTGRAIGYHRRGLEARRGHDCLAATHLFHDGTPILVQLSKVLCLNIWSKKYFRLDQLVSEHAKTARASKLYK